jgi:hypothetical protein
MLRQRVDMLFLSAEMLFWSPEIRPFTSMLQKYVPFLLILLFKGIYDHSSGKLMCSVMKEMQEQDTNELHA